MSIDNIENLREIRVHDILHVKRQRAIMHCPICNGGHKTACFSIKENGFFKCFSCGAHGSNGIDLFMHMGCTFKEAVEELKKY